MVKLQKTYWQVTDYNSVCPYCGYQTFINQPYPVIVVCGNCGKSFYADVIKPGQSDSDTGLEIEVSDDTETWISE